MSKRAALGSVALATAMLALGYALDNQPRGVFFVAGSGGLWLLGQRYRWGWIASLGLVAFTGSAAAGIIAGVGAGWMLGGLVAALSAWDLDRFAQRLADAGKMDGGHELERRHLRRLLAVVVLGLTLAGLPLIATVQLSLGWALLLGLFALLGLSETIRILG